MAKTQLIIGAIVLVVAIAAVYFFLPKENFGLGVDKLPSLTGTTASGYCSDSDGTDSFIRGATISLTDKKSHTDYCVTQTSVMEGSCAGDNLKKEQVECKKGCVEGACVK